jgi:hypothetical protein
MGLKPKTNFLVYEYNDLVILKKLVEPDLSKELKANVTILNCYSAFAEIRKKQLILS